MPGAECRVPNTGCRVEVLVEVEFAGFAMQCRFLFSLLVCVLTDLVRLPYCLSDCPFQLFACSSPRLLVVGVGYSRLTRLLLPRRSLNFRNLTFRLRMRCSLYLVVFLTCM